jgi:hypothetical protein
MNYKYVSLGLGFFSLALGMVELLASKRIGRGLDAQGNEGLIKGSGAREVAAGAGIPHSPAHAPRVWNCVAGDAMDLVALGAAARNAPRNKAVWGAIAFVVGATVLDVIVARGLERTTGKSSPAPV